jgi:hypothetical protein
MDKASADVKQFLVTDIGVPCGDAFDAGIRAKPVKA